jgi:hypothetical protein
VDSFPWLAPPECEQESRRVTAFSLPAAFFFALTWLLSHRKCCLSETLCDHVPTACQSEAVEAALQHDLDLLIDFEVCIVDGTAQQDDATESMLALIKDPLDLHLDVWFILHECLRRMYVLGSGLHDFPSFQRVKEDLCIVKLLNRKPTDCCLCGESIHSLHHQAYLGHVRVCT